MNIDSALKRYGTEKEYLLRKLNRLDNKITKLETLKLNYNGILDEISKDTYYVPTHLDKCNKLSTDKGTAYYYYLDNGNKIVGSYYKLYSMKYNYNYNDRKGSYEYLIHDYEKDIPKHFDKKKVVAKIKKYILNSLNKQTGNLSFSNKSFNLEIFEELMLFK